MEAVDDNHAITLARDYLKITPQGKFDH